MPLFVARSVIVPNATEVGAALPLVLRADEWDVLTSAQALAERIHADARAFEQAAQAQAARLLEEASLERERLEQEACAAWENRFMEQARKLEITYQTWRRDWQEAMTTRLDQALEMALQRVSLKMDDAERLRCVISVLEEVGGQANGATLHLAPADYERSTHHAADWPWPLEQDSTLKPGQCRLEGKDGSWLAEFSDVIERLIEKKRAKRK